MRKARTRQLVLTDWIADLWCVYLWGARGAKMENLASVDPVAAAKNLTILITRSRSFFGGTCRTLSQILLLLKENFGRGLSPCKDIDKMWHLHMLHPQNYYDDCMRIFGRMLDRNGDFGSAAKEKEPVTRPFAMTADLWLSKYGTPCVTPKDPEGHHGQQPSRCTDVCREQGSTDC
jgi:hypothetical protein